MSYDDNIVSLNLIPVYQMNACISSLELVLVAVNTATNQTSSVSV
ncbi:MAG: hypothetical protein VX086_00690 [Pseudomonadota bacterium]|nr:hypothetical protein [Pseudomonadota bacterium]